MNILVAFVGILFIVAGSLLVVAQRLGIVGHELNSHALAVDPNLAGAHAEKGNILSLQGRPDEAIAENERALALDPAMVDG